MKLVASLSVGVIAVVCLIATGGCSSSHGSSKVNGDGSGSDGSGANGSGAASGAASAGNGSGANGSGANGSGANGSGANGSGANGSGGTVSLNVDGGETTSGGSGPGTGGSPEVCDGKDNDNNGVIDDVDKNGDGVCDCLLIATLGLKGMWGEGDVFSAWLTARSDTGATDLADQTLTPELLGKYQVIVAQDLSQNHAYSADEVAALSDWVNKGGGFMTLIGYGSRGEEANVNLLLAPFTMDYGDQQILPGAGGSTPITMWTPHPVDNGVTAVGINRGCPVEGMGTTFATGGGSDVGKAQEVGMGHVLMWGDEWITYNSEWESHPDYQVQLFWLNAIKWLTVAGKCQVAIPPNPPK